MKTYLNPKKSEWPQLSVRPQGNDDVQSSVEEIMLMVQQNGDESLRFYSEQFDGWTADDFRVPAAQIEAAANEVDSKLQEAIRVASENIQTFHNAQGITTEKITTTPGVTCWRKAVGLDRVGLYIPGGTAPLFSTVLMLGIPAVAAGCKQIVLCTPPDPKGNINPAILYAAQQSGITEIYKVGGAQAIAAMAYGTESIPKVDKIFGPGNTYVTMAKQLAQMQGTAIDMPAGPSEVLIIADENCVPEFVAADLLSQAEHGADSQVILCCTSSPIAEQVQANVSSQLQALPRAAIASQALENSSIFVFESLETCMDFSNNYAPEHLILACTDAEQLAQKVCNAGSVFLGNYTCESAGDYASGTNHTLPTNGYAKAYSGVSLSSFQKHITFQKIDEEGLKILGPVIETMAAAEGLQAHKNAVTVRLNRLKP